MQLFVRQYAGISLSGRPLPQQDAVMVAGRFGPEPALSNQVLSNQASVWQKSLLTEQISCGSPLLLAVADGVSASPAAAAASRLVLKQLAHLWQQNGQSDQQKCGQSGESSEIRLNSRMLRRCQQHITHQLGKKPTSFGASTTVAVFEIVGDRFKAINAGDSRVWRYRQGLLEQLSVDHCFASELKQQAGQALAQCYQALTSYLAADPDAEDFVVSVTEGTVQPGDQFMLTTDGIHDEVPSELLAQCLALGEAGGAPLARLLNQYSFDDNASLIWLCC